MTVWEKIEGEEVYAVAIYNYPHSQGQSGVPHLPLEVGELVQVLRRTSAWCWGRSTRRPLEGAFPASFVKYTPVHIERFDDEIEISAGDNDVAHEIAITLREWLPAWKEVYKTDMETFQYVEVSMNTALTLRAGARTADTRAGWLRRTAHTALHKGARRLRWCAPLVSVAHTAPAALRRALAADECVQEAEPTESHSVRSSGGSGGSSEHAGTARGHTLAVRLHGVVLRMVPAVGLVSLYSATGVAITEPVWLPLMGTAHPKPIVVAFTDLSNDFKKEKVYVVFHILKVNLPDSVKDEEALCRLTLVGEHGSLEPSGVCHRDLTRILGGQTLVTYTPCEKESLESLTKKLIANKDLKDNNKSGLGLWVSAELLEGDYQQAQSLAPTTLAPSRGVGRALALPELGRAVRNVLYVTGLGTSGLRGRSHSITLRLYTSTGRLISNAVRPAAGMSWSSSVTALDAGLLTVQLDAVKDNARLLFLLKREKDREKDKFYGLAQVSLLTSQGTAIADGVHTLPIYKIDHKHSPRTVPQTLTAAVLAAHAVSPTTSTTAAPGPAPPAPLLLLPRAALTVRVQLASTQVTQRPELLGVLSWSSAEADPRPALRALAATPSAELAKMLPDLIDALAQILTQVADTDAPDEESYAYLTYEALLAVCGLLLDHKFGHLQAALFDYVNTNFCHPLLYLRLMPLISAALRGAATRSLMQTCKCLHPLMLLCGRAYTLHGQLHGRVGGHWAALVEELFTSLQQLMTAGSTHLACQGAALRYLPSALAVLPGVRGALVVSALQALPLSSLNKQRVSFLLAVLRGPAGEDLILREYAVNTFAHCMQTNQEGWRGVDKAARLLGADCEALHDYRHCDRLIELCVEGMEEAVCGAAAGDVSSTALAGVLTVTRELPVGTLRRRAAALLVELLRRASIERLRDVVAERGVGDLLDLLGQLPSLVAEDHWPDLKMLTVAACVRSLPALAALAPLATVRTAARLATSSALSLDTLPASVRRRLLVRHGDVRGRLAEDVAELWGRLDESEAIPMAREAGGHILTASLPSAPARRVLLRLLWRMCVGVRAAERRGADCSLHSVRSTLVHTLDECAVSADRSWNDTLAEVVAEAEVDEDAEEVTRLANTLRQQLAVLLEYHEVGVYQVQYRMYMIKQLMEFYKEIGETDLYIKYVHMLCDANKSVGWSSEAGFGLLLAAAVTTSTGDGLFLEAAQLLQDGGQWSPAARTLLDVLARRPGRGVTSRAELHERLAATYRTGADECVAPRYYRVVFYGGGPRRLVDADLGFIYRGNEYEQLADFTERLLDEWPKAQVLTKLDYPGKEITESDQQYLQIVAVTPQESDARGLLPQHGVADEVLDYYRHNEVHRFVYTRPVLLKESWVDQETDWTQAEKEAATAGLERTELTTDTTLPSALRKARIMSARCWRLSPPEKALEVLEEATSSLKLCTKTAKKTGNLGPLSLKLSGILDAQVQGGVQVYERALLSGRYLAAHPTAAARLAAVRRGLAALRRAAAAALTEHAPGTLRDRLERCYGEWAARQEECSGDSDWSSDSTTDDSVQLRHTPTVAATVAGSQRNSTVHESTPESSKSKLFSFNSSTFNHIARYSSAGYFGTLQSTPKRRNKRNGRKSEVSSTSTTSSSSQWYTVGSPVGSSAGGSIGAPAVSGGSLATGGSLGATGSASDLGEPLKELTQELVWSRPPRVEAERRLSARNSLLVTSQNMPPAPARSAPALFRADTTQSPPPLPAKSREHDTNNNGDSRATARHSYDTVSLLIPRGSFLYSSMAKGRNT